jgi:hypothetical protein
MTDRRKSGVSEADLFDKALTKAEARPIDLKAFDRNDWMTRDETMDLISQRLDKSRRVQILTRAMVARLSLVDDRSSKAGLRGANRAGLSVPPRRKR